MPKRTHVLRIEPDKVVFNEPHSIFHYYVSRTTISISRPLALIKIIVYRSRVLATRPAFHECHKVISKLSIND
jgi:hypothetical protein